MVASSKVNTAAVAERGGVGMTKLDAFQARMDAEEEEKMKGMTMTEGHKKLA